MFFIDCSCALSGSNAAASVFWENAPKTITTLSSRDFNPHTSGAKKAAQQGPVYITDRGRLYVADRSNACDALIAATALVHGMTVVTRITQDFAFSDAHVLNPWQV